ncbi:MAG: hypothetical protein NUW12_02945 [Firmicutes bacterium]|nr:hypothetical protein [Bacillota bacterium]MDH7495080.1 hypothetical protein [Bacillota bacterium]
MDQRLARAVSVGFTTFFLAILVNFVSKILLGQVGLVLGLFVLLGIVLIGVVFDVIGTASTAAKKQPFHAMAAKKVRGAHQAIRIVRSADRVANFCNDVVGDMAGTVSGAVGVSIAMRLAALARPGISETLISTVVIGVIAGLTVGGKAWSKNIAVSDAEMIVLAAGKVMAGLESVTGLTFLRGGKTGHHRRARLSARNRERQDRHRKWRENESDETP